MIVRPTRTVTRYRRWLLVSGGALLLISGWIILAKLTDRSGERAAKTSGEEEATAARRLPDLAPSLPAAPAVDPVATVASRVPEIMNEWRAGILAKDAEIVERVDRVFASHPREFTAALMDSAGSDPEERVRSFSTRVLGKLRSPESVELMRKLLADRSEYVRFNAAWAIGELADRQAAPRLRELEKRDPAPSVRTSAAESLRKLSGG